MNNLVESIDEFLKLLTNSMSLQKDRRHLTQEGLLIAISTCLWRISRNNEYSSANTSGYNFISITNGNELATKIYETVTELSLIHI